MAPTFGAMDILLSFRMSMKSLVVTEMLLSPSRDAMVGLAPFTDPDTIDRLSRSQVSLRTDPVNVTAG